MTIAQVGAHGRVKLPFEPNYRRPDEDLLARSVCRISGQELLTKSLGKICVQAAWEDPLQSDVLCPGSTRSIAKVSLQVPVRRCLQFCADKPTVTRFGEKTNIWRVPKRGDPFLETYLSGLPVASYTHPRRHSLRKSKAPDLPQAKDVREDGVVDHLPNPPRCGLSPPTQNKICYAAWPMLVSLENAMF